MKFFKILGAFLAIIVLLLVGIILFGPTSQHLERTINISASSKDIFREVNSYSTFNLYSAWAEMDSLAEYTFEGPKVGIGSKILWTGPVVQVGSMEIVESEKDQSVKNNMWFEGFPGISTATWKLSDNDDGTVQVTYDYDWVEITGFWKVFGLLLDMQLGSSYERTLEKLKERVENKPKFDAEIVVEQVKEIKYVGKNVISSMDPMSLGNAMGVAFGDVVQFLTSKKIRPSGYPLAVYLSHGDDKIEMICGLPIEGDISNVTDNLTSSKIEGGNFVKAVHMGDYVNLEKTHNEISEFVDYYQYEVIGSPWEEYPTDPFQESDTTKWMTNVYYPIK